MDEHDRIGRFETVRLLGRGGMGEVYLARDPLIDRLVAVKLLSAAFDGGSRDRFTREARAAGRLAHDNVVTVFDVGEHRDRPFIAMEYVPGETLWALLRRRPSPPRGELLRLIQDACSGLAYAHRSGVVHLDVKPENLIRRDDGRLKILDFGLARVVAVDETHTRHSAGTLRYMSPEQLNGGNVDHRSDVFAIGCVLYEVLTGQPAFGSTWPDVLARLNAGWVPTPSAVVPHLHPALERMTTRALALNPGDRYQDLGALATELAMLRRDLDIQAPHDTGSYADGMDPAPVADPPTVPLSHPSRPRTDPPASDARNRLAAAAGPPATPAAGISGAWWATAAAVAVAVVAVAAGLWPGRPAPQVNEGPSSAAPGAPAVQSTPAPASSPDPSGAAASQPAAVPKSVGPAAAAPATPSAIRPGGRGVATGLDAFAPSVWQAVARRDYPTALRLLRAQPDQATALVGELAATARATSDASRRLAEARGGTVRESEGYRAGVAALARAEKLDASGPSIDGLAARWEAGDAFARAVPAAAAPPEPPMSGAVPVPAPPGPSRAPEPSPPPPARDVTGTLPPPDAPMPAPPPPEAATHGTPTPRDPAAETPETPTATPAPVAAVTAEAGVRAALAAYKAAYDTHDVAALRAVYSGLSADQAQALTRTFADAVSYRLDLRVVDVTVGTSSATATCVVTHALVPKVGSPSRTTQTATFQFAPGSAGWVITQISARR